MSSAPQCPRDMVAERPSHPIPNTITSTVPSVVWRGWPKNGQRRNQRVPTTAENRPCPWGYVSPTSQQPLPCSLGAPAQAACSHPHPHL